MRFIRRDFLLFAGLTLVLVVAVWAAFSVTSRAVNEMLRQDAEATGEAWARYLAANVADLDRIVAGGSPSPESIAFFEKAQKVGDVFLYKIFDAKGGLRLVSNELDTIGRVVESIPVHNPEAAEVVLEGETEVEAKEGASADRPAFYAEAYVPVFVGGEIGGIVETYVDQSAKRAAFTTRIAVLTAMLAAIIAVAFGLPALGLAWRTRQKRLAETQAEFLTHHDSLTKILNRARFLSDVDRAVAAGTPMAVHIIDLDRFKELNDTLGQPAGDDLLQQAARRLAALAEDTDLVARIGGDEFAFAHVMHNARQVTRIARQIMSTLAEPFQLAGHSVEATASVGSAVSPTHGANASTLVKSAETALNHAKGEGFGARALFRLEMDAELQQRRRIETLVRDAVDNERFELHFQPIRRATDLRLAGFEALIRLPAPEGGYVPSSAFVPVAEHMGLIVQIGEWTLSRAAEIAATWPGELTVAVNLSPTQFADGRIIGTVKRALEAAGLAPGRLELEITEGMLLSHTEAMIERLAELKALGVTIAMDDFGTGYSSLNYLWKFPFDKLKIDQSFVQGIADGDDHLASVIKAIVALARSLGMAITAEGVESEEQVLFLNEVGVDLLQGFFLGRPVPLAGLPAAILHDFRQSVPDKAKPPELFVKRPDGEASAKSQPRKALDG